MASVLVWSKRGLMLSALLLCVAGCARSSRLPNGGMTNPPAQTHVPSVNSPVLAASPTTAATQEGGVATQSPAFASATWAPTLAPMATKADASDAAKAKGDALEGMLNQLTQMNQAGDSLGDIP
jgi:hypothetical protein